MSSAGSRPRGSKSLHLHLPLPSMGELKRPPSRKPITGNAVPDWAQPVSRKLTTMAGTIQPASLSLLTCGAFHFRCARPTSRLLARRADGIFVAPFEQSEIDPDLFRAAMRGADKEDRL